MSMNKTNETYYLLGSIYHGMNGLILAEMEQAGISHLVPSHLAILAALFGGKELSMKELSEQAKKAPQTMSTLVRKLVDLGYARAEKDFSDRRTVMVSLTEAGEALEPRFNEIASHLREIQFQGLSETEQDIFCRVLQRMGQRLQTPFLPQPTPALAGKYL